MGHFKRNVDFNQLDWSLLQNSNLNLYIDESIFRSDLSWLKENQYKIIEFDCKKWNTKFDIDKEFIDLGIMYDNCSNLDALKDCIAEIELSDKSDAVIVLRNFNQVVEVFGEKYAEDFLDVIALKAREYLLFGVRLIVLVTSDKEILTSSIYGATSMSVRLSN